MEALSREFHTSCPWDPLYADDLELIAETLYLLCVNMGKTKLAKGLDTIKPSRKYSCSVCKKEVGVIQFYAQVVMHEFIRSVVE